MNNSIQNAPRFSPESLGFLNRRSQVQILTGPPDHQEVPQLHVAVGEEPDATLANVGFDLKDVSAEFPVCELIMGNTPMRAKIDTIDLPKVLAVPKPWRAYWHKWARTHYVLATVGTKHFYLHRVVTDAPKGLVVDHIHHDGLDNRQSELRVVIQGENIRNARRTHSKYGRGVKLMRSGSYEARIKIQGKFQHLGTFSDAKSAAQRVREALAERGLTFLLVVALLCSIAFAGELPDAPSLKVRPARVVHVDGPFVGENAVVHNAASFAPKEPRNVDWQFLTAHSVYAGALAFDLYLTKQGVSHGCEEANGALGPYPGTGRIVGYGIAEFAAITTMDYFLKRIHIPGLSYIGAGIGTTKHLTGGRQWLQTNCL